MKFNYVEFILRMKAQKDNKSQQSYREWLLCEGSFEIENEKFYNYLTQFAPLEYKCPKGFDDEEDRNLLLSLVCGSSACDYDLVIFKPKSEKEKDLNIPDLLIAVESGEKGVVKIVSELELEQIYMLIETLLISEISNQYNFIETGGTEGQEVMAKFREYKISMYNDKHQAIREFQNSKNMFNL